MGIYLGLNMVVNRYGCTLIIMLCSTFVNLFAQENKSISSEKSDCLSIMRDKSKEELSTDLRKELRMAKQPLADSLLLPKQVKDLSMPNDSVSVSYENGKFNLPKSDIEKVDINTAEEKIKNSIPSVTTDIKTDSLGEVVIEKMGKVDNAKFSHLDKIQEATNQKDSIEKLILEHKALLNEATELTNNPKKILSQKSLKRLYDSLGISRLDSAMALMGNRKEVSKEEMLDALNQTMSGLPAAPPLGVPDEQIDEIKEMQSKFEKPDFDAIKLNKDDLMALSASRGFKLPEFDSLMQDSLRKVNLKIAKLKLNESEVTEEIKSAIATEKVGFWGSTYFDGVISYLKDGSADVVQVSPAIGVRVNNQLSFGLGPTVHASAIEKVWSTSFGYRTFAKYEFLYQRAYFQIEDSGLIAKGESEYLKQTGHRIFAGGGALVPLSKKISLNICVLYTVNQNYSDQSGSPWVIRLGLSSFKQALQK